MSETSVLIRPMVPGDIDRILREWLNSFRNSPWAGVVPNNLYKRVMSETVRQLLARGARVDVACYADKPEMIVGFSCTELTPRDKILHYVFVRSYYRNNGIARALLDQAGLSRGGPFVYTFRTPDSRHFPGGRHMPELARRREAYKPTEGDTAEMN